MSAERYLLLFVIEEPRDHRVSAPAVYNAGDSKQPTSYSLDSATRAEPDHVLRRRAQERPKEEEADRAKEDDLASVQLRELAVTRREAGAQEKVTLRDPCEGGARAVEVALDSRKRRRYDRRI